jgi:antirestriction protein ArdC
MNFTQLAADLTEHFIQVLESGKFQAWKKTWACSELPRNLATGVNYQGGNVIRLMMAKAANSFASDCWLTYNQAQELQESERARRLREAGFNPHDNNSLHQAGAVFSPAGEVIWPAESPFHWSKLPNLKGQHTTGTVYRLLIVEQKDKDSGEKTGKTFPRPRVWSVFNASQLQNFTPPSQERTFTPVTRLEALCSAWPVKVTWGGNHAFYSPGLDRVQMPNPAAFYLAEAYYCTLLHEFGHSTGHPGRLNRDQSGMFGSPKYAKEELVGELISAFLSPVYGVAYDTPNTVAYLGSWLKALKDDRNWLLHAMGQAERAARLITSFDPAGDPLAAPVEPDQEEAAISVETPVNA